MSEENTAQVENEANSEKSEEIVPVDWEEVRETFELRQEQLRVEEYVSKFLLEMERQKTDLLSRLTILETRVFNTASEVRDKFLSDKTAAYELKLPNEAGGQAYFIRKQ